MLLTVIFLEIHFADANYIKKILISSGIRSTRKEAIRNTYFRTKVRDYY